jgi:hypothetical protein
VFVEGVISCPLHHRHRLRLLPNRHPRGPPVEPASAVSGVIVVSVATVSLRAVVAARGFVSVLLPAPTRAKGYACDHQDNDHDHNNKERYH